MTSVTRRVAEGAGRRPHTSQNPSTGNWLASYTLADDAAIDRTLATAAHAFQDWRATSFQRRAALLERVAIELRANQHRFAQLITAEMGKPVKQGRAEIEKCATTCEFYAAHGESMLAPLPVAGVGEDRTISYRPLGVILAIMPWNFPFWQVFRFAVPALMAGNVGLLKHAPNTTGCALAIEALFREAGLPEGCFSALLIDESQVEGIIADSRVAAVTLTGSERAGSAVGSIVARHLKKSVLELGGSDAYIVCADANLEMAVKMAITGRFQNSGQSCIAAKRFFIEASIYTKFEKRFVKAVEKLLIGDPREEKTEIGPLARRDIRDTLERQVNESVAMGAKIVYGGHALAGAGYYYVPTVLTNIPPESPVMREEVFGPVAPLMPVRDIEEALTLANASVYGLGASLWTADIEQGRRLAGRLEVGSIVINGIVRSEPQMPFGGIKRSGYGRELGAFGMFEFMNIQSLAIG